MQFLTVLLALSFLAPQQQPPQTIAVLGPPEVSVLKLSWSKFNLPVGGDRDPFAPNDLVRAEREAAREAQAQNREAGRTGTLVRPPVMQIQTSSLSDLKPGVAAYSFTMKLKNSGSRIIRGLEWAYVFIDPATDQEVGRAVFRHNLKLSPNKEGQVIGYSNNSPVKVFNVKGAKSDKDLKQRVEIYRVRYDDGSAWDRPIADVIQ
jgi:hypothetical protein